MSRLNLQSALERYAEETEVDDPGDELWMDEDPGDPWIDDDDRTASEWDKLARRLHDELSPSFR